MSAWVGAVAGAVLSIQSAEAAFIASLPEARRRDILRRRNLDLSEEVQAAERAIVYEGLNRDRAEVLREFARLLAEERRSAERP